MEISINQIKLNLQIDICDLSITLTIYTIKSDFFNRHQNIRRSVERQRDCKIMVKKVANNIIEMTFFTQIFVKYFEKKYPFM